MIRTAFLAMICCSMFGETIRLTDQEKYLVAIGNHEVGTNQAYKEISITYYGIGINSRVVEAIQWGEKKYRDIPYRDDYEGLKVDITKIMEKDDGSVIIRARHWEAPLAGSVMEYELRKNNEAYVVVKDEIKAIE